MELGQIIKRYREDVGMSQREFAKRCHLSNTYISMLENGKNTSTGLPVAPSLDNIRTISHAMGASLDEVLALMDDCEVSLHRSASPVPSGFEPLEYQRVPLIGEIACGTPITAEENVEDYVAVPAGVRADFCLRCKGDSMKPTCLDGDLVLIRRQPDVEDGQIAAVIIDGEATLKHVYHLPHHSGLQLVADNPAFPPILCGPDASVSVQIVGRAVAYQRLLL